MGICMDLASVHGTGSTLTLLPHATLPIARRLLGQFHLVHSSGFSSSATETAAAHVTNGSLNGSTNGAEPAARGLSSSNHADAGLYVTGTPVQNRVRTNKASRCCLQDLACCCVTPSLQAPPLPVHSHACSVSVLAVLYHATASRV